MEKKKVFDLESKRKVYFSLGLFIVSAGTLCAFTYRVPVELNKYAVGVQQKAEVPILLVENNIQPEKVEVPQVEKLPDANPSTPIFDNELLNNIKLIGNTEATPTSSITGKGFTDLNFTPELGDAPDLEVVVKYPNQEAEFIGNWHEYLKKLLVYPEESREIGDEGTVYVGFVVERDGSLTDIKVLNKGEVSKTLQQEATRVVKQSPKWKPGILNGEKVRTTKVVRINFILG